METRIFSEICNSCINSKVDKLIIERYNEFIRFGGYNKDNIKI